MISESDDETVVILLLMLRPMMLRMRLMPMILMPDAVLFAFVLVAFITRVIFRKCNREDITGDWESSRKKLSARAGPKGV